MKILLLNLVLICTLQNVCGSDSLIVIAQPNLTLRSAATTEAAIVGSIPFGEKVKVLEQVQTQDTVNGMVSFWLRVEYNGIEGFIWRPFTVPYYWDDELKLKESGFRLMIEGNQCANPINYDPDLLWYGLYETAHPDTQLIKKITPKLVIGQTLNEKEYESSGLESREQLLIETGLNEKSIILIGSKDSIKTGKVSGKKYKNEYYNTIEGFLYPEQYIEMKGNGKPLYLLAREHSEIADSNTYTISKLYELVVFENWRLNRPENHEATQNISNEIPHMKSEARVHGMYKNPIMVWHGDLDDDKKPDFIIRSSRMSDTGGVDTNYMLFLSSRAKEGKHVEKVAHMIVWGCFG